MSVPQVQLGIFRNKRLKPGCQDGGNTPDRVEFVENRAILSFFVLVCHISATRNGFTGALDREFPGGAPDGG